MKKIIMILLLTVATITFGYAQEDQREAQRINKIELPLGVQEDLTLGEFSDWEIIEAFEVPVEARKNNEAYEVIVKKEEQIMHLFYNKDGELLRQDLKDE